MAKKLKVLSLFDGMSCGRIALEKLGYNSNELEYYASEINKPAIMVATHNYPDTIHIGDVTKISFKDGILSSEVGDFDVGHFDLVMGGSPCQSISTLGDGSGLEGKSGLFYHWLRVRDEVNPRVGWLLENVVGSKKAIGEISSLLGTEPTLINSNTLSAQNRKRLYWTNLKEVKQPQHPVDLQLSDILDAVVSEESTCSEARLRWLLSESGQQSVKKRYTAIDPIKANCLTARSDASWNCNYVSYNGSYRKLSCNEYEKLQTVPVDYTKVSGVKTKHRYEMLGNGWTVGVIVHILGQIISGADY